VATALNILLAHYERDGDAVLRNLAVEEKIPIAKVVADEGRRVHRQACERVFAPYLPDADHPTYGTRLDAFVAATDLYVWKLLRRDLRRSADETRQVFLSLINGLINLPNSQS
jgi:hypothetical protein